MRPPGERFHNNKVGEIKDLECEVEHDDQTFDFFISKPIQPTKPFDKWKTSDGTEVIVNPYFWVTTTPSEKNANMVHTVVQKDGCKFRILTNTRAVQPMEQLCVFKAATEHAPLEGAEVVQEEDQKEEEQQKKKEEEQKKGSAKGGQKGAKRPRVR